MGQALKKTEIGYQPTSDFYPGSYLDGIHVHGSCLSSNYFHENVIIDPFLQVRCFSYEEVGLFVPKHWHNSLEILLLSSGEMEAVFGDATAILQPGEFAIINSRDIHATNCPEHSMVCALQIPYPFLMQHIPDYDSIRFRSGPCGQPDVDDKFRALLLELQSCHTRGGTGYQLHFTSMLYELLYLCVTYYQLPAGEGAPKPNDEERARLITVMDFVNAHYNEAISLRDAASTVALNPEYFCRFFKKNMGLTFLEFVNQVRFSHVCDDILRTDISITELLTRHGFTNYKLFRRMFQERYGCTPQEKRKETSGILP